MSKKQEISVVIPVYNTEKYLDQAIESVLKQNEKPLEIIVVDDASSDNSINVAEQFGNKITLLKQPNNNGCGASRNRGIEHANGKYLAFIDADDLWTSGKLKNQLAYLENNPDIDMVFGMVEQFISPELSDIDKNKLRDELKKMPGYVAGAMLICKETFLKVGLLNEKLELGEYIDWFSRAKDMGLKFHLSDAVVLKRRIHTSNMGIYKRQHLKDYTAILREALARKRMKK
ncbi:MAG: glycosyltransferase family 2 protein [Bacteroidetes bacterium]|nr:MAG: glycosyltransferase family 2 protein [Bacteroidota bacterium]